MISKSQENIDGGMVILDSNHTQEHVLVIQHRKIVARNYLVVFIN